MIVFRSSFLTSQATSNGTGGTFGDVKGSQHRGGAHTETGDKSTDEHKREISTSGGGSLHNYAHAGDHASNNEGPSTTVSIREPGGDETCEETASLKSRDN